MKFAEAPNPNKKRPLVYFAPAWAAAGAGMEENGQIPAMSFVQPMFSDVSLQQNGASAIPTPGPRPLLIHHPCKCMIFCTYMHSYNTCFEVFSSNLALWSDLTIFQ